jgi:hypothetical protein
MKKRALIIFFISLLFSGCATFVEMRDEPELTNIELTETPYQRYLRHHFYFEGLPGKCRFCGVETIDTEIRTCEECFYRVYKIKKQKIKVEPLQFNEPFHFEPQYTSYELKN